MSRRSRYLLATAMLAAVPHTARAQRETFENVSAWVSWFGEVELNHHWSIDNDGSVRRTGPASEPAQYLWRASLRRDLAPNVRVAAGYAGSDTHPYGRLPIAFRTPEHRVFEQLQLYHPIGRLQFTHRYRLEQRWAGRVTAEDGDTAVRTWLGYLEQLVQRANGRQFERNRTIMTTLTTAFHLPGAGK